MNSVPRRLLWAIPSLGLLLLPAALRADMHREGEWPDDDEERVTLAIEAPRAEAIRRLAEAAGWSVVVSGAQADGVNLQVKDQPAVKVLELLLADGDYVAKRDGQMISIAPRPRQPVEDAPPALPTTPAPPAPPSAAPPPRAAAGQRGEDRVVTGQSVVIGRNETVGNLTVLGGSAQIRGTVTDDVAVFGGSMKLYDTAHVQGDIAVLGGSVQIAKGARVDGDVSTLGGSVKREDETHSASISTSFGEHSNDDDEHEPKASLLSRLARELSSAIARAALLFAFGTVLLALATQRMEVLQRELETRPMRAFAMGVVGLIAGAVALVALCVTIVGIPVAIVAVLVGALGVYAGICAAFTVLGARLLRGRTTSPYAHLALGCALYLVVGALPVVGWFVTVAAVLLGLGVLVSTRAAGLLPRREPPPTAGALSSSV